MVELAVSDSTLKRLSALRGPSYLKTTAEGIVFHLLNHLGRTFYSREPPPKSKLLNLGCGDQKYAAFVNADCFVIYSFSRRSFKTPDWMLDVTKSWRCQNNYWEGVFCEHVIEHLSYAGAISCLTEAHRTLQPGRWIRVVVPDVRLYVGFYSRADGPKEFVRFSSGPEAISNLTQSHGHVSVWDANLLRQTLEEIGFTSVREVAFGGGSDAQLIKDSPQRQWESCYVEGMKAPA